jgi:hypothetical protein
MKYRNYEKNIRLHRTMQCPKSTNKIGNLFRVFIRSGVPHVSTLAPILSLYCFQTEKIARACQVAGNQPVDCSTLSLSPRIQLTIVLYGNKSRLKVTRSIFSLLLNRNCYTFYEFLLDYCSSFALLGSSV